MLSVDKIIKSVVNKWNMNIGKWWNDTHRWKHKSLKENLSARPLCPLQTPYGQACVVPYAWLNRVERHVFRFYEGVVPWWWHEMSNVLFSLSSGFKEMTSYCHLNTFTNHLKYETAEKVLWNLANTAHRHIKHKPQNRIKKKEIPLQAWTGPEGSRRLSSQISRQSTYEGGMVVSPTQWPPSTPRKYTWYSFLLQVELTPGPKCSWNDYVNEKFQWYHRELNLRPSGL